MRYPTSDKRFLRPTWAEINLGAFRQNFNRIKKKVKKNIDILSVVKADAYGHGVLPISKQSLKCGAKILGVATIEEGVFLRENGIKAPILILGSIWPFSNFYYVIKYNLTPTVSSFLGAKKLSQEAKKNKSVRSHRNNRVKFHIKIDTGMGRIGISPKNALSLIRKISFLPEIEIEGVFSHFASADEISEFTKGQSGKFKKITDEVEKKGIKIKYRHIANSVATINFSRAHFNLIRPGLALYGLLPYPGISKKIKLKPVLSLKTKIIYLKWVKKGQTISYGRTWKAKKDSLIATLPVGYADGYNRLLSNKGEVLIRGKRFPVVGRVCMDMIMVDVTPLKNLRVGEKVVLIGKQGKEKISAEELASKIGSINYEVVCSISERVPRIYI